MIDFLLYLPKMLFHLAMVLWYVMVIMAALIIVLWFYGRRVRQTWTTEPKVRSIRAHGDARSKTAFIVLTGAFNGPQHTEQIVDDRLRPVGDVYVIDYPLKRFNVRRTMLAAHACVAGKSQYNRVIVVGFSLGGLVSLHLLMLACLHDPQLMRKMRLLIADAPLYPEHLRIPGGAPIPSWLMWPWRKVIAPLLQFVHFGPLFNQLSPIATKVAFFEAPAEMREAGMDDNLFKRHMRFLWDNKLSTMVEQVAVMAGQKRIFRDSFSNVPLVYVQCGDGSMPDASPDAPDKVIMGDAAHESWRELFPDMHHKFVGAATMHVAVVEGHDSWGKAIDEAVQLLLV